ncbi:hypothetical protein BB560_007205 [Smittium megazygosporum]|uniref:Dipeptidyl-peptidase V n=1 Tax=Smittium megazygosporum TaxID=133381 RepID=A0A2T9XXY6_9FUNG|nr:hypothetical protein BB560_007205 [Smittium megazygosporum]
MKISHSYLAFFLPSLVLADVFSPDSSMFPDWSTKSKFLPTHLTETKRISSVAVSPNSKNAVFALNAYNNTANKSGTNLRILSMADSTTNDLTPYSFGASDSGPFWIDDSNVGFVSVRGSPNSNLFSVSTTDGSVVQVTNYTNGISGVVYSSAAKRIAFTSSVFQGMTMDESAEEAEVIADHPSSGVVYDKLFVRHWDTWITKQRAQLFTVPVKISNGTLAVAGQPSNLVASYQGEWGLEPDFYTFSPDGNSVLFSAKIEGREESWQTEAGIFISPADGSAAPTRINSNFKGAASNPVYSNDGKYIAWLQMATPGYESDQNQVILYEIASKTQTRLIPDFIYSPSSLAFSEDSKSIFMTVPVEKDSPLYQYDLAKSTLTRLTADGVVSSYNQVSSDSLVITMSTFQFPDTIFTVSTSGDKKLKKLSTENDANLGSLYFSPTDNFWFNGAMNEKVQALVVYPYGFDPSKKYPVACIIHGGPQSSWQDGWSYRWNPNIYANQGFVGIIINFHGGDAYGQNFTNSIQHNWGTHPFEDIMTGMDVFLEKAAYTDSKNTVALGASYGGYMVNWINGQTDRFNALVCHDGVFSTISMSYSTEELWFVEHDLGKPYVESQRALVEKFNPERYVANWVTPTLIIQGELDYRIPVSEGLSTFTALQRRGIDSKLLYFPDENHWVLKRPNSLKWHSEVLKWIGKYTSTKTWSWEY